MDQRLLVTAAFVAHLLGGGMLAIASVSAPAEFTEGQLEFLVLVGYLCPFIAMGLVWMKNYVYGAPLLVGSTLAACWFAIYFFYVHDNPANALAMSGDGAGAYLYATIAVVIGSLVTAGVGAWLWYRESPGFRSAIDRVLRPPNTRE